MDTLTNRLCNPSPSSCSVLLVGNQVSIARMNLNQRRNLRVLDDEGWLTFKRNVVVPNNTYYHRLCKLLAVLCASWCSAGFTSLTFCAKKQDKQITWNKGTIIHLDEHIYRKLLNCMNYLIYEY